MKKVYEIYLEEGTHLSDEPQKFSQDYSFNQLTQVEIECGYLGLYKTALMIACETGQDRVVQRILLENDIDFNQRDQDGNTALFYSRNFPSIQQLLVHKDVRW